MSQPATTLRPSSHRVAAISLVVAGTIAALLAIPALWINRQVMDTDNWANTSILCREFQVKRLDLFGSAARNDFRPEHSDLDFLVEFAPLPTGSYASTFFGFKAALEQLLGRSVDLIVASSIRNPYFRQSVEQSKALLYAA